MQAGDQRSSSADNVQHAFDLQLGGGLQVRLTQMLSLQLTPAEYNFALPEAGATHSYSAKVGISWTFWKQSE
jgi:hypothetical protein